MRREQLMWAPIRLGMLCIGLGVIALTVLFWLTGDQLTTATQLPFVLSAGGIGIGLLVFGAAAVNAQRARLGQIEVEEAAARLVVAAARLAHARTGER